MKILIRYLPLAFTLLLLPAITRGQVSSFNLDPNSEIVVKGTSTIHDWEVDVEEMNISMKLDPERLTSGTSAGSAVESFSLTVAVESMESGKGSMNRKMYGALKKDDHPNIMFKLRSAEPEESESSPELDITGDLTIAGTTKAVSLPVKVTQVNVDSYMFEGSYSLNMKEYDVDPPSAMLGTIRTGEEVEIVFKLIVKKSQQ